MSVARQSSLTRPAMLYAGNGLKKPPRVVWTPADLLAALIATGVIAAPILGLGTVGERLLLGKQIAPGTAGGLFAAVVALAIPYGALFWGTVLFTVGKYGLPWGMLRFQPARRNVYRAMIPLAVGLNVATGCLAWGLGLLTNRGGEVVNAQSAALLASFPGSWAGFVACLFIVAVAAPVAEETYFRGMLYGLLRERYGAWPAIGASAFIFAAAHVFVFGQYILVALPQLFVLGLVLALVVERTRSLYPAILLHSLNNSLVVVALFWGVAAGGGAPLGA